MQRHSQEPVTLNVSDAVWSTDDLDLLLRVTVEDVFGGSLRADTFFEQMDCSGEWGRDLHRFWYIQVYNYIQIDTYMHTIGYIQLLSLFYAILHWACGPSTTDKSKIPKAKNNAGKHG